MQPMSSSNLTPAHRLSLNLLPAATAHAILVEDGFTPVSAFFTDAHRFVPPIDPSLWQLIVTGANSNTLQLTLSDLAGFPYQHIECTLCNRIANRDLQIGHAQWGGILLIDLLAAASINNDFRSVRLYGADGYQVTLPSEQLTEALLATEMNEQPLTPVHGYPLRLIVPGITEAAMPKWLQRIELLDATVSPAQYTVPTSAALLYPHYQSTLVGEVQLSGIAFAGNRIIKMIEVSIDDTDWMPIAFDYPASPTIWTRWHTVWNPPAPGHYRIDIRACDADGMWSAIHHTVIHVSAAYS